MSEASSYNNRDYRSSHPEMHSYVDPRDHSSTSFRRNRYDSPRRVRDVSWISTTQQPAPNHDPYARWYPPSDHSEFPGQVPPMAHSSPAMHPTHSFAAPSPMIGEYMNVEEDPEDEDEDEDEEVLQENDYGDEDIDFEFPAAPEKHMGGQKGPRRWVGGFVQGLRKFPGFHKTFRRPPHNDVAFSADPQHVNEPQMPTISSLNLRPLTPSLIAQTVEYMEMPEPQVQQPPSPQHHLHPYSVTRKPPPLAPPSPVYPPAVDAVPQVLSTVSERSGEQTGTQETHPHPHSNDHTHSSHTNTRDHSHSSHAHSHSHNHSSQSTAHPVIPNNTNAQTGPPPGERSAATVTDYVTVPPPPIPPPPPTGFKRFLHNLDQLPWVENDQVVDSYFPGRSSHHRRHPNSNPDGWKPAASWYNRQPGSFPIGMTGPTSATLLYGWPSQIQKNYLQPEIQFPHGYAPAQPVFLYPNAFPPPGAYGDISRGAV